MKFYTSLIVKLSYRGLSLVTLLFTIFFSIQYFVFQYFDNCEKQAGAELGQAKLNLELGLLHCIDASNYYLSLNTMCLCEELSILSSSPPPCHPCHTSLLQDTQNDPPYKLSTDHLWYISSWIFTFPGGWGVGLVGEAGNYQN